MAALMTSQADGLRVLQVAPRYFPHVGGVETHVYEVSRRLAATGVAVTVLATDPSRTLPERDVIDGVPVRRVPSWPARRDYYFAPRLAQIIGEGRWDVVHCQGCHTLVAPMALMAARRAGVPSVLTFHSGGHSSRLRTALRGVQWRALRSIFAQADVLIGVSRYEAMSFQARLGLPAERFAVIPNGGRLPEQEPEEAVHGDVVAPHEQLIVSIGRLERYKGHHRLIAAMPKVLDHRPDARLLILGEGPYEAALWRQIDRLGLWARVRIRAIPPIQRGLMRRILARANLIALLSDYEAHPIAVMEALALRRPVLVAATSGLSEFAERGLAAAVPAASMPDEIAAAVLDQLQDPVIPDAITLPTWEECATELRKVYERVAARAMRRESACASCC